MAPHTCWTQRDLGHPCDPRPGRADSRHRFPRVPRPAPRACDVRCGPTGSRLKSIFHRAAARKPEPEINPWGRGARARVSKRPVAHPAHQRPAESRLGLRRGKTSGRLDGAGAGGGGTRRQQSGGGGGNPRRIKTLDAASAASALLGRQDVKQTGRLTKGRRDGTARPHRPAPPPAGEGVSDTAASARIRLVLVPSRLHRPPPPAPAPRSPTCRVKQK